jgi:hypothetical protein
MDEPNAPPAASQVMCTSCRRMHYEGYRCGCLIDRAEVVAREGYELHRVTVPAWRRPREWDRLPERARQELVRAGLDLVEALEGAGWRLQAIGAEPAHEWPEDDPEAVFDRSLLPAVDRSRPRVDPRTRVTDPPMIQGVTLREWLIHHHPTRDRVWADVVREMYGQAATAPAVASYFHEVLARPDGLEDLQRHFTAMLTMVCGQGVTVGVLESMFERHANVTNEHGQGITGEIYDAVVAVLVDILASYGVPAAGRAALAVSIRPLRDAIVRDPDQTDPAGYPVFGAPDGVQ